MPNRTSLLRCMRPPTGPRACRPSFAATVAGTACRQDTPFKNNTSGSDTTFQAEAICTEPTGIALSKSSKAGMRSAAHR